MIELPEGVTLSKQINAHLVDKIVVEVLPPTHLHKFTFFNSDPSDFAALLVGERIEQSVSGGAHVDICMTNQRTVSFSDGAIVRYHSCEGEIPQKYQLMILFDDNTSLQFNTQMYSSISAFVGELDNEYRERGMKSLSPLSSDFTELYFEEMFRKEPKRLSMKAFLATHQRFPGIGNGVLQDVLLIAGLHPKRTIDTLADNEKVRLFTVLKSTLQSMANMGGRDTESDLFGTKGGYKTLLKAKTLNNPCPFCKGTISKESYLGGSIYYCRNCQIL